MGNRNCDIRECYAARVEPIARRAVALYPANHHHKPPLSRANAREGAGCGRHARRGYLPDLSPRRRTGSGPIAVSRAASVARSDLNRALWTLGTRRPRHLDVSPSARARPGPRAFPFVSMGAPFLEPPGRASHTYRSDEMAFATAKVPDRALAAKRFVETHYRGADFLGARGGGTRWDASTALGPAPLRGMRRDEARAKCLSTTRDGLAFPRHTPRPFGFGDPLGATAPIAAARRASVLRASSDSDAARARRAARRRVWVRASETRASRKVRSAWGTGASRSKNRSPPPPARPANGARRRRGALARRRRRANVVSRARLASETILSRSAKRYVSPFQAERAKQATIRALKAKGEWPNPKPPVVVIPGTRRSGAKKADLRAVADLDAFDPRALR